MSNSKRVLESVPESERAIEPESLDMYFDESRLPMERALGLFWSVATDEFIINRHPKQAPYTKRGLLSVTASIFDPMGFVTPVTLSAKLLFQSECAREDSGWDEALDPRNLVEWQRWLDGLPALRAFALPAGYFPLNWGRPVYIEFHHFCDGSSRAYGAVSYLRAENSEGEIQVNLIEAKSRLAPLKHHFTIPRLELCSAVLATQLARDIRTEHTLQPNEVHFWSDSMVTLQTINNTSKRFKTFTANRKQQILNESKPEQWHYVETGSNPADDCSRGLRAEQLLTSPRWAQGPDFLWRSKAEWPKPPESNIDLIDPTEVKKEVKVCSKHKQDLEGLDIPEASEGSETVELEEVVVNFIQTCPTENMCAAPEQHVCLTLNNETRHASPDDRARMHDETEPEIICATTFAHVLLTKEGKQPLSESEKTVQRMIEYHSRWWQLKRHVGWILEFISWLKNKKARPTARVKPNLAKAETAILKFVQRITYRQEVSSQKIHKGSKIYKLDPKFGTDGLLRVQSRFEYAQLPEEVTYPIILPQKHHVSMLIARWIHITNNHCGKNLVISISRKKYWIVHIGA